MMESYNEYHRQDHHEKIQSEYNSFDSDIDVDKDNHEDDANSYQLIKRSPSDDSAINANTAKKNSLTSCSSSSSRRSLVDSMVYATKECNRMVVEYCTVCTDYMDKQVQYEVMQQSYQAASDAAAKATSTALRPTMDAMPEGIFDFERIQRTTMCNSSRAVYDMAATMFDEESVVDSVVSR